MLCARQTTETDARSRRISVGSGHDKIWVCSIWTPKQSGTFRARKTLQPRVQENTEVFTASPGNAVLGLRLHNGSSFAALPSVSGLVRDL